MIVFSAATAGSNRQVFESAVVELAKKNGKRLKIINFIDEMLKSARNFERYINSSNLPNLDIKTLELLKMSAFHAIEDEITGHPNIDYLIDGHMTFWWKNGPLSLINVNDFKKFSPDLIISIVAPPNNVFGELQRKKEWMDKTIDVYEIAIWSEVEIYTADLISHALNIKNYIIGMNENPRTLYDLIYNKSKIKVYASFTIEHRKENYEKLDAFLNKLRKYAIVFDPRSIDIEAYKMADTDERMKTLVFNQTVRRDYSLIDQSDAVVIHLSALVYSSGVDSERMHAHTTGKKVLLYFPFEKYSPFTPYFVDNMFKDEDELLKEIKKMGSFPAR